MTDGEFITQGKFYEVLSQKINAVYNEIKQKTPLWAFILVLGVVGPIIGYMVTSINSNYHTVAKVDYKVETYKEKMDTYIIDQKEHNKKIEGMLNKALNK